MDYRPPCSSKSLKTTREVSNNYLLNYANEPKSREITPRHSRRTDNIETFEASAFGVCTIRLSDILITEPLWTIQTAATHSEGSQMGEKRGTGRTED